VALAGGLVVLAGGRVSLAGGLVAIVIVVAEMSASSIAEVATEIDEECVVGKTEDLGEVEELEGKWRGVGELENAELESEENAKEPVGSVGAFVEEVGRKSGVVIVEGVGGAGGGTGPP